MHVRARMVFLGLLVGLVCGLPARPAVAQADSDGDGLNDAEDPMPGIAAFPLHWSVQAVTFRWADERPAPATNGAWAAAHELVIYSRDARGAMPGARSATCRTASPLDGVNGAALTRDCGAPLGLFGSGGVDWRTPQRLRAQQLARCLDREPGRGASLTFDVVLHNRAEGPCRFDALVVPVRVGRETLSAVPADSRMRDNGFLIMGGEGARDYRVSFETPIEPRVLPGVLAALQEEGPWFALEGCRGRIALGTGEGETNLTQRLRSVVEQTTALTLCSGDGERLVWRVARRLGGKRQLLADWIEAVNAVSRERCGRNVWDETDGILTSLVGWDTGSWDRWWMPDGSTRTFGVIGWRELPLDRGLGFRLRDEAPTVERAALAAMTARRDEPVFNCLLGRRAWLAGRYTEAAEHYGHAAAAGYAPGQNWLAYCLYEGQCGVTNTVEAARAFAAAAVQGYAPGAAWHGRCLLKGRGVSRDEAGAARDFSAAAAQGYPEGQMLYGLCLARGVGVAAQPAQARVWLRRAAEQESVTAQLGLGLQLLEDPAVCGEGVDWLRCAAAQGDAKAQTRLGSCLLEGRGTTRDATDAVTWLTRAAEQGHAEAQRELGRCLRAGVGARRDDRQAVQWFRRAAEQADPEAQTWLGMSLLEGRGVKRNAEEAVTWIRRAAEQRHGLGQYLMGLCAYAGMGVERDDAAARQWFARAAAQKIALAQVFLGFCHYEGRGTPKNPVQAAKCFRAAAEQGSPIGQVWMAECYAEGKGVPRDLAQAREWAGRAAKQGFAGGRIMLGRIPEK